MVAGMFPILIDVLVPSALTGNAGQIFRFGLIYSFPLVTILCILCDPLLVFSNSLIPLDPIGVVTLIFPASISTVGVVSSVSPFWISKLLGVIFIPHYGTLSLNKFGFLRLSFLCIFGWLSPSHFPVGVR